MSKWGTNSKAEEKRQKQKTQKQEAHRQKAEKQEAQKWKDDQTDKFKEKQRQKQKEKEDQQKKKDEKKKLIEQQEKQMAKINKKSKYQNQKLTIAQIAQKQMDAMMKQNGEDDDQIEDIYNDIDQSLVDAHSVQEALDQLNIDTIEKHPEKRVKAAWMKYVDDNLARIKKQNSGMRRNQHLNMLRQQWKKAPENPFNHKTVSYNTKI